MLNRLCSVFVKMAVLSILVFTMGATGCSSGRSSGTTTGGTGGTTNAAGVTGITGGTAGMIGNTGGGATRTTAGMTNPRDRLSCSWIAGMGEPIATVAGADAIACASGDASERVGIARRVLADELFLQRPSRLNGVVVGRIGRQVHDADAVPSTDRTNAWVVVSFEVVHDQDVASAKLGKQTGRQPVDETVCVRRFEGGVEGHPTGAANRSIEGQVLAPVHRHPVDKLASALDPRVAPPHRGVQPRLVEKYQAIRGDAGDPASVGAAFRYDFGPQTLQRPAAFFLTT